MSNNNEKSREEILKKIRCVTEKKGISKLNISEELNQSMKEKEKINYVSDLKLFLSKLKDVGATVSIISNTDELVKEVHLYVAKNQIKTTVTIPENSTLQDIDWNEADVTTQYDAESLIVSVTNASMGIEETGTLVLLSSPSSPTGMNFLPEHHLIVLNSSNIVKSMEDVWKLLREDKRELPRTINLITGPSRTADIEYEIEIGAHGPKKLHVIIINE